MLLGHLDKIIHATWRQPVIRKILFSRLYYYPPRVEAVLDWTLEKEMKLKADRKSEYTSIIDYLHKYAFIRMRFVLVIKFERRLLRFFINVYINCTFCHLIIKDIFHFYICFLNYVWKQQLIGMCNDILKIFLFSRRT